MKSLRVRLLLLLGVAILLAATLQFATSFQAALQQANKLFDYHMQQMAFALQDSGVEQFGTPAESNSYDLVIQIWSDEGVRTQQTRPYLFLPKQAVLGYSTVTLKNGEWRIYAAKFDDRVIQVAQKLDARRNRAISLALHSLWPMIPISLLLFVAAWWVVTSALSPLIRIGYDLANRNADSLAPVSEEGVPREVSLLVTELNSLLTRMSQALQSQQWFLADAAHELRSPLTALKLQAQTLARAKDEIGRKEAIGRLLGGVDRATRLVEQLLALARQHPSAQVYDPVETSLSTCIEQAISDVNPLAAERSIRLTYADFPSIDVTGEANSLRILVRNLLDNAVRYTPEGGEVQIELTSDDTSAIVTVQDSGPGIPRLERARVFDRFYRVSGTSPTQSGSGLGLAIAKVIVERHGGTLELLDAGTGGLAVKVSFPVSRRPLPPSPPRVAILRAYDQG